MEKILARLSLTKRREDLKKWEDYIKKIDNAKGEVKIALIGKYVNYVNRKLNLCF